MGKNTAKIGEDTFQQKKSPLRKKSNKGRRTISKIKKATLRKDIKKKFTKIENGETEEEKVAKDKAWAIIRDFEENGPSELYHIFFVSEAIRKNIEISLAKGDFVLKIGRNETKQNRPVYLVYHKFDHWTSDFEEQHKCKCSNNCLFEAVSKQIKLESEEVKSLTLKQMMDNKDIIAQNIADIEFLELLNPLELESREIRYDGTGPKDASHVLDNSQTGKCFSSEAWSKDYGHPRGHASDPKAKGETNSVENYSKQYKKSGFHSKQEQNMITHLVLDSDEGQEMIEYLNEGSTVQILIIKSESLRTDLPLASYYLHGKKIGKPTTIKGIKAVLKRYSKEYTDRLTEVLVYTIFPLLYMPEIDEIN